MIHVRLDQFEGPLGLLLYLIRKEEMDIYNIQIHLITSQYLEHIKRMRELDLEVAGDFIAMAATLIHIKSRLLLPQYDENGEPIEAQDDPRKELVQKLVEYQKFQEASKELNQRPLLGRDVWARGMKEELPIDDGDIIVDEGGLFTLISMYRKVVRQIQKNIHTVRAKGQSIAARILELRDRLVPGRRVTLKDLVTPVEWSANKVLITFLSLLELTKMGFTTLFQTEAYSDIFVDTKRDIDRNVIDRVEEYDAQTPEQTEEMVAHVVEDIGAEIAKEEIAHESEVQAQMELTEEEVVVSQQETPSSEAPAEPDIASDEEILTAEKELGLISGDDFELAWADFVEETSEVPTPVSEPEPVKDQATVLDLIEDAKSALDLFEEKAASPAEAATDVLEDEVEDFEILETVKNNDDIERGSNNG